jgi:hypothetical protein
MGELITAITDNEMIFKHPAWAARLDGSHAQKHLAYNMNVGLASRSHLVIL